MMPTAQSASLVDDLTMCSHWSQHATIMALPFMLLDFTARKDRASAEFKRTLKRDDFYHISKLLSIPKSPQVPRKDAWQVKKHTKRKCGWGFHFEIPAPSAVMSDFNSVY